MSQGANRQGYGFTRLDNGVRVITQKMPHLATAAVGVWVDVGARYEAAEVNGVAHFLEHMAFKGTERRSAQAIAEEIEAVGGHLNAYTTREQTAFYARVLGEDVPLALDLLGDILRHSVYDAEELRRERGVVLQEIHQVRDVPDDFVFDLLQDGAFPNQPMGRSILGPAEVVERLDRDDLIAYQRRHYAPGRLVVAAAGQVDHQSIVELATDQFGDLRPCNAAPVAPAVYAGGLAVEADDLEQVHLAVALPGVSFDDPDFYAAQIFATAYGGGMSSRLFQEIREKRGLAYSAFAFSSSYMETGLFGMYAGTAPQQINEIAEIFRRELDDLAAAPGDGEIARARAQLKASMMMSLEGCSSVCEDLARQHLIFGDYMTPAEVIDRIDAVDRETLQRFGERLRIGVPTVALLGPGEPSLAAGVRDALAA